jgi:hypothetical protein
MRRRLFVDKQVQGTLLFRIAIYWCFSVLTVCLITLCVRALTIPAGSFWDFFAFNEFFKQYGVVLLASLVLVPLIMLDVVATSNRFAGPLLRMRRSMRELAAGQHVERIQFRDKDFWRDVATEFNLVVDYVERLKSDLAKAEGALDAVRELEEAGQK